MVLTDIVCFEQLQALLDDYEFKFLETLSDPVRAVKTMLIVKLLSSHARDEVYLVSENDWILVKIRQYYSKSRFTILLKVLNQGLAYSWCL